MNNHCKSHFLLFTLCFIAPIRAKEASYSIRAICG